MTMEEAKVKVPGFRSGKLTALEVLSERDKYKKILVRVKCDCGEEKTVILQHFLNGLIKSCGKCGYAAKLASERRRADLAGKRFGKLTAVRPTNDKIKSNIVWLCQCDCGRTRLVQATRLIRGAVKSCGLCGYMQQAVSETRRKYSTKEECYLASELYRMKQRCYNPNNAAYPSYGGRGIKIYDKWLGWPQNFIDWALASGWKPGLTIERNDVNGDYCPENCCWISLEAQARNKTNTRRLTIDGVTLPSVVWAEKCGITANRLYQHGTDAELTKVVKFLLKKKEELSEEEYRDLISRRLYTARCDS